jgi:hypothetical protein
MSGGREYANPAEDMGSTERLGHSLQGHERGIDERQCGSGEVHAPTTLAAKTTFADTGPRPRNAVRFLRRNSSARLYPAVLIRRSLVGRWSTPNRRLWPYAHASKRQPKAAAHPRSEWLSSLDAPSRMPDQASPRGDSTERPYV